MVQIHQIKFGFAERVSRAAVGFVLLSLSFTIALGLGSMWFAAFNFAAMYPLVTALVAWDPFYYAFELTKDRIMDFHILHM